MRIEGMKVHRGDFREFLEVIVTKVTFFMIFVLNKNYIRIKECTR